MKISIRNYIMDNFMDSNKDDIRSSIEEAIKNNDEITLPGLGVFFEILWSNSSIDERDNIIGHLYDNLKK